jgi:hypothetical protein
LYSVFFVGGIVVGLHYYGLGKPPKISEASLPSPPSLEIYVTDPRVRLKLTVELGSPRLSATPQPSAVITPQPNREWIGTISLAIVGKRPHNDVHWIIEAYAKVTDAYAVRDNYEGQPTTKLFEGDMKGLPIASPESLGKRVGQFATRATALSGGTLVARLPVLGQNVFTSPGQSNFVLEETKSAFNTPPDALPKPGSPAPAPTSVATAVGPEHRPLNQKIYDLGTAPKHVNKELLERKYYSPRNVVLADRLNYPLMNYQLLIVYPSNPMYATYGVTWEGSADLSPTLTAITPSAQDDRSKDSFISGVAFATAAAAGIAIVQELGTERDSADKVTFDRWSTPRH